MLDVAQGKLVSKELERKASILKKRLLSLKVLCSHGPQRTQQNLPVSRAVPTIAQRVLVGLVEHAGHALRVRRYAQLTI